MPAKKKVAAKHKPAKKSVAKKQAPRKLPRRASAKPARKSGPVARKAAPKPAPTVNPEVAKKMAAFSQQVVKEEEEPVQVRSFIEARQGIEASKELNVKTGEVKRAVEFEEEVDAEDESPPPARSQPQMEPLAGPVAVPKRRVEEFQVAPPPPKGKKGAPPTRDDLGRIELRMQRGSGDEKIAEASPDYLQRSFNQAAAKGKVAASSGAKQEPTAPEDKFEVAMDKPATKVDRSLLDFGDVEIAQQTRKGAKKLGTIDVGDKDN